MNVNNNFDMSYNEDQTLDQLRHRIQSLKEQRSLLMNDMINQRKQVEIMQTQMSKMKKQKSYLEGLIKEKMTAAKEYDRIIAEAEKTLFKLSENTKKLLLSVDNQYGKYMHG